MNRARIPICIAVSLLLITSLISRGGNISSPRVVVIGDSNIEIGHITDGLRKILAERYGAAGSGYRPIDPRHQGKARSTVSTVHTVGGWTSRDMFKNLKDRLNPPHLAPDGLWLVSPKKQGGVMHVDFKGPGLDLYWLAQPGGGLFSITIDGKKVEEVDTSRDELVSVKTALRGAGEGDHRMKINVESGRIILQGLDVLANQEGSRAVCHKWGNGWATTSDFVGVDEGVFKTALKELNPNVAIILLGASDHDIDKRKPAEVRKNLVEIAERINESLPECNVMIVSTVHTGTAAAKKLLPEYINSAYPGAARDAGVEFWDMATWFGPFKRHQMMDARHCNSESGHRIAEQLLREIKHRFMND